MNASRTAAMHKNGTSGGPVVPAKRANKGTDGVEVAQAELAERVEERGRALGKTGQQNASGTQSPKHNAPSALNRQCEAAKRDRKAKFTALLHHVTTEKLAASFYGLKRRAAP